MALSHITFYNIKPLPLKVKDITKPGIEKPRRFSGAGV